MFPGLLLEGVCHGRQRRSFRVTTVDESPSSIARYARGTSQVKICSASDASLSDPDVPPANLLLDRIPGLGRPVTALNEFLVAFTRPRPIPGPRPSVTAVVHGAHGTGKTHLLDKVAATGWGSVYRVKPSDKSSMIRDTFDLAR